MPKNTKPTTASLVARIHLFRGQKVMLDRDLAELYHVATRDLNKAVRRNRKRFPLDFMFQLRLSELKILMFQIGTSSWGGTRKLPYAFTEQGIAMLSSVLRSERAIGVNIHIIRVFTRLRQFMMDHKVVLLKLEKLEKQIGDHDAQIRAIFAYMKKMFSPDSNPPPATALPRIGFRQGGSQGKWLLLKKVQGTR